MQEGKFSWRMGLKTEIRMTDRSGWIYTFMKVDASDN